MAPSDLLRPLEGQRDETLRLLDRLAEADLETIDDGSGWTVRRLFVHLARAELGQAFLIRQAAEGDIVYVTPEARDAFNQAVVEAGWDWDRNRIRAELAEARGSLREVFQSLQEPDLDRGIRWPEWPARTIGTSIPYMLEHEDSHVDQIRHALHLS
jgi:uncharacterized damage-inducible protein DinB